MAGCAQITEVNNSPGVHLLGALTTQFELARVYSVAVAAQANRPELAGQLITMLRDEGSLALRLAGGFEC